MTLVTIGNNKLNYWVEEWNPVGTSKIWVNVTSSGTDTILMYYGNPSATSESNGDDVFDFFDDFNDGIYTDKWTNPHPQGTYTESGGVIQLYSTGYCSLDSIKHFTGPCVIESRTQRYTGGDYITRLYEVGTNNTVESGIGYYGLYFAIRRRGTDFGPEQVLFCGNSSNAWKEWRGLLHGTTWHVYRGDVLDNWDRDDTLSLPVSADGREYYVQIFTHEYADTGARWDWVRVRRYASTEPSASVGDETALGPPVGGTVRPVNKLALLAPYIILAALLAIATVSVAVYWRRR
jgi:hypothetical protein